MSKINHELAVEARTVFGNNASRRARKAGRIPAVVYSKGQESRSFFISADEWESLQAHGVQMVTLKNGTEEIPALVKEVQINYLKNHVLHVDFQQIDLKAEITAMIPIHAHGVAVGAAHGGILEQELFELACIGHAADLPEAIKADVTGLDKDGRLYVKELVLPEGIRTNVDGETVVFHVVLPHEEAAGDASEEGSATEPEAINETKAAERAAAKDTKKE